MYVEFVNVERLSIEFFQVGNGNKANLPHLLASIKSNRSICELCCCPQMSSSSILTEPQNIDLNSIWKGHKSHRRSNKEKFLSVPSNSSAIVEEETHVQKLAVKVEEDNAVDTSLVYKIKLSNLFDLIELPLKKKVHL